MKTILKQSVLLVVLLGGLIFTAGTATAHHGYAAFDTTREATVTGKVRTFQWTNPHTWLWIDVPNSKGGVDVYGFEGMSPNYLGRRGWTRDTLKPGDQLTVTFFPFKNPSSDGGSFRSAKRPNGEVLKMTLPDDATQP